MKVTNATSLLELQNYCSGKGIILRVDFVSSAAVWRVTITTHGATPSFTAIGRTIGEAMQDAFKLYEAGP